MSDHFDEAPKNSAIMLLPVVMLGMLVLMTIMYFGGSSSGFYAN